MTSATESISRFTLQTEDLDFTAPSSCTFCLTIMLKSFTNETRCVDVNKIACIFLNFQEFRLKNNQFHGLLGVSGWTIRSKCGEGCFLPSRKRKKNNFFWNGLFWHILSKLVCRLRLSTRLIYPYSLQWLSKLSGYASFSGKSDKSGEERL